MGIYPKVIWVVFDVINRFANGNKVSEGGDADQEIASPFFVVFQLLCIGIILLHFVVLLGLEDNASMLKFPVRSCYCFEWALSLAGWTRPIDLFFRLPSVLDEMIIRGDDRNYVEQCSAFEIETGKEVKYQIMCPPHDSFPPYTHHRALTLRPPPRKIQDQVTINMSMDS